MMETNKYYTPSIEEFHVGFELEIKTHELRPWEKHTWLPGDQAKSISNYLDQIRVKYLDSEDIESLGFKKNFDKYAILYGDSAKYYEYSIRHLKYSLKHIIDENKVIIKITNYETDITDLPIFNGIVKNKSELINVFKQVEVLQ